jgi:hypothetical protein
MTVSPAFSPKPDDETAFIIAVSDLPPQQWRILKAIPKDLATIEITGLEYNDSKYDAIDLGTDFEELPSSSLPNPNYVKPPGVITVTPATVTLPEGIRRQLRVTWVPSTDIFLRGYVLSWRFKNGPWQKQAETGATTAIIDSYAPGKYDISIVAINRLGIKSSPATKSYTVGTGNPLPKFTVTGLELTGQANSNIFQQRDAKFSWRLNSPGRSEQIDQLTGGYNDPYFECFIVEIWNAAGTAKLWPKGGDESASRRTVPSFIYTEEMNAEAMHPDGPTPTFQIQVRALDKYGTLSVAAKLTVVNPPPSAPVNFSAVASFKNAFLSWENSTDVDLDAVEVRRSLTNSYGASVKIATVSRTTTAFVDSSIATSTQYYYFLRSKDTFGNFSDPTTGASVTPGTIGPTDIADFAVNATKLYQNTVVLWLDAWTDNSTDGANHVPGSIYWNAHTVYFKGVAYPIPAGTTANKYVYWRSVSPGTYQSSNLNPVDNISGWSNNKDFQIAINTGGIHELAWYGFANAVIGSAYIASLVGSKIVAGTITADRLVAGTITALYLASNSVTAQAIAAGAVTADKLSIGMGNSLVQNPSFEQIDNSGNPIGWDLIAGATIVAVNALDGVRCLRGATGIFSGANSSSLIPVASGATYYFRVGVRPLIDLAQSVRAGFFQFTQDGVTPSATAFKFAFNATATSLGFGSAWNTPSYQMSVDSDCAFIQPFVRSNANNVAGAYALFDALYFAQTHPNESLTSIDGGKITTGSVESNNYESGVSGFKIGIDDGSAEFANVIIRDSILYHTLAVPTFTNDYYGTALVSRTYNDYDLVSIRAHAPSGFRIRYELNREVASDSPFWPGYPPNQGSPGTGPNNFVGFIQADGSPGGVGAQKPTTFHVCVVGGANYDILGPEVQILLTWTPPNVNDLPVLTAPRIYRHNNETAQTRGAAGYIVRADCDDLVATLKKSTDGTTYANYTRDAAAALGAGANVYFKAVRSGYKDSPVTSFGNTATGVPNQGGAGGGGSGPTYPRQEP